MIPNKKITAKAPYRVSFSGGGTDLPEFFKKFGGCVLSSTIDKYITVEINPDTKLKDDTVVSLENFKEMKIMGNKEINHMSGDKFDIIRAALLMTGINHGIYINVRGDCNPGSGLGTSSAAAVCLLGGLLTYKGLKISKEELSRLAIKLEIDFLGLKGGWQDQYASGFGGLNIIKFNQNKKVIVERINIPDKTKKTLEDNLLLYYMKKSRNSSRQQEKLVKNMKNNTYSIDALSEIKSIAIKMRDCLADGRIGDFVKCLNKSWELKIITNLAIATSQINKIYALALQNGALGGKLLGAGGGGTFLFYCPKIRQIEFKNKMAKFKGEFIKYKFENKGFHIL